MSKARVSKTLPDRSHARALLAWFRKHARVLPWRETRDAYAIWISEVMLQQTQVVTVVPYFLRFLERYPDVTALARADLHDVLRLWEGLGYYRRARDLHRAAQVIAERHAGVFPQDAEAVRDLPGLGRYTTNAVLSQAFEQRLPILEANSIRVLCRLMGIRDDPKESATLKRLWEIAESMLPRRNIGDFNQALMELGALVCTPQDPHCGECPLKTHCEAYRLDAQAEIPKRARRPEIEQVREVALVIRKNDKVLLVQRPATGRWASLWEFPHHVIEPNATANETAQTLLANLGLEARVGAELLTIRHGVTRFRIEMTCMEAEYSAGSCRLQAHAAHRWIEPQELGHYPVSSPQRRLAVKVSAAASPRTAVHRYEHDGLP